MNELCHHGVKGQKWGVRRYQKIANEKIDLIERGKLKAGRDFVIQTDWDIYGLPFITPSVVTKTQRIIERNSTSSYQTKRYTK